MEPIFTKKPEDYTRTINILRAVREESAFYLHKHTQQPFAACLNYVEKATEFGGEFGVVNRDVLCLSKETPGNRLPRAIPFTDYFADVITNDRIMSPTLAVYFNPKQKKSILSEYISGNIKARAKDKAEMFAAEAAGNKVLAAFKDLQQTSRKLNNNAMSGAHVSSSTPLYNKSAHSTLTSFCRSATSYGNANNEKFIAGNRHYWSVDVVISNIISISRLTDMVLLQEVVDAYRLHIPTYDEVMECIEYSTKFYWKDPAGVVKIRALVETLTPLERCAFVYVSDMYHLGKYNPELVRSFLGKLSRKVSTPVENPDALVKGMDGDVKAFVSLLCAKDLKGRTISDLKNGGEKDKVPFGPDPEAYMTIASTAYNVRAVLEHYRNLIKALWVTENMPSSVANIPTIIRRTAVVSDTDSTIFTVQYWTNWYVGKDDFSDESLSIAWSMIYLSSQLISHVLAKMSANMGIPTEHIHRIAMKNEYAFPVLSLAGRAKHYYAYVSAREGNVYDELELELKGVAFRNANAPVQVKKKMKALVCSVMDAIMKDGDLSIRDVLKQVVDVEYSIKKSVMSGGYEYMSRAQVKDAESYTQGENAPNYAHYGMWQEVFADHYGESEPPPYFAVKVSLDVRNQTEMRDWLARMPNQTIAEKMRAWLEKSGKSVISQILVPQAIAQRIGIPPEVVEGVNIRKLIFGTMDSFYLVLESLGLFITKPDNSGTITRLLTDYYTPADFEDPTIIIGDTTTPPPEEDPNL